MVVNLHLQEKYEMLFYNVICTNTKFLIIFSSAYIQQITTNAEHIMCGQVCEDLLVINTFRKRLTTQNICVFFFVFQNLASNFQLILIASILFLSASVDVLSAYVNKEHLNFK